MCRHGVLSSVIFLAALAVVHTTSPFLCLPGGHCFNKCCPEEFVLRRDADRLTCVSVNVTTDNVPTHEADLLKRKCQHLLVASDEDLWPHCIERLAWNQSTIVRVSCGESPKSNITFKKCCQQGYKYDLTLHTCLPANTVDFDVYDFLEDNSTVFDAIVHGIPECDGVLVDFNLSTKRMSDDEMASGTVCVDDIVGKDLLGGRLCGRVAEICSKIPCVSKCCPPGKHFYGRKCSEADTERGFNLTFYDLTNPEEPQVVDSPPVYGIVHVSSEAPRIPKFLLNPKAKKTDISYLSVNGSLFAPNQNNTMHNYLQYCLEDIYSPDNTGETKTFIYFRPEHQQEPPDAKSRYSIIAVGLILSCVFLLGTLVVYLSLPILQNLHGMTLMCHVTSFLVAYICLATTQIGQRYMFDRIAAHWGCATLGFVMLFAMLSSFAWMNIMCFDIWWTFGGVRGVQHMSRKTRERKRFAWYSLYAWGVPVVITGLALYVQLADGLPEWIVKPSIGTDSCWFPSSNTSFWSKMVYFVIPIAILISCNMVLFILTARSCSKVKAEINRMQKSSDDRSKKKFQADKNKLMMNGKLFVVMGVGWVIELLGILFPNVSPFWWAIPDTLNALQGVFIFFIFVVKRKVKDALAARFGCPVPKKEVNSPNALLGANLDARKSSMSSSCFTNTTSLGTQVCPKE